MLHMSMVSPQIKFQGAASVEPIADQQQGPTCGFEAVENVIQLFRPAGNYLSDRELVVKAMQYGGLEKDADGYSLDPRVYRTILLDYSIGTHWYPFDYAGVVIPALLSNRVILAMGDSHYLNPIAYPDRGGGHAFVITNFYTDETGTYFGGCVGIDSNFSQQQSVWDYVSLQNCIAWAIENVTRRPLLVSDNPVNWSNTARWYRLMRNGQLVPVPY